MISAKAKNSMTPDGYGICYNPQKQQIVLTIISFKNLLHQTAKFSALLCEALQDMKDVINTIQSLAATKL